MDYSDIVKHFTKEIKELDDKDKAKFLEYLLTKERGRVVGWYSRWNKDNN